MRKLIIMLLVVVSATANVANANTEPVKLENNFAKEIQELLEKPSFTIESEMRANISLTVNDQGEMVVLSVDSENETIKSFVKSRLNYQKIKTKLNTGVKFYTVPVRLVVP